MTHICEVCQNVEHKYLSYPMLDSLYATEICFFCKKQIKICCECNVFTTHYTSIKPVRNISGAYASERELIDRDIGGYTENLDIPKKYNKIVKELVDRHPQCIECNIHNTRQKFSKCEWCRSLVETREFVTCKSCEVQSCVACAKKDACAACGHSIDGPSYMEWLKNRISFVHSFFEHW